MAVTIFEKYMSILLEFENDVRDHPEADFTPYIRTTAARLAGLEKAYEKSVINRLFLSLYGGNAASLRSDLSKLDLSGTITDISSQRPKLLQYLYKELSRYFEEITNRTWDEDDDIIFSESQDLYMYLTLPDLKREHPGKLCICRPHERDIQSGQVVSWMYYLAVDSIDAARVALKLFDLSNMTDAVVISTDERITVEEDLAARFYRISCGMEMKQCADWAQWQKGR